MNRALFSSKTPSHATPEALYRELDAEFRFTLDPCPLNDSQIWDGALMSWAGHRVFCNPPYGRGIAGWLMKAREAECAVYLLPARTDTRWWHNYALKADEIRFIRGRLKFGDATNSAPFPSVILIYGKAA
jgi:site-specific DNA-methyltransferase (adenine-specific)